MSNKPSVVDINDKNMRNRFEHGGIVVRILIAITTLVIIGGVIIGTLLKYQDNQHLFHRKAMAISEYGLLTALQKLHEDPSWKGPVEKTSYDDGWFKVTMDFKTAADTTYLTIISEGHMKSASDNKKCVLSRSVVHGDSVWVRRSMQ